MFYDYSTYENYVECPECDGAGVVYGPRPQCGGEPAKYHDDCDMCDNSGAAEFSCPTCAALEKNYSY